VRDDIVHIDPIIGVGELAISDHRSSQPTLDELLRVAGDAHVAGLLAGKAGIVHLHVGGGERGLDLVRRALDRSEIPARVFQPTHVNRRRALLEEALELARLGCVVDVTAFPSDAGDDTGSAPVGGTAGDAGEGIDAATALERYLDAGCPPERVTISTDAGGSRPVFDGDGRVAACSVGRPDGLAATLTTLLRRGGELERVLPAFTANVAGALRLRGKGRVAVGGDADLVTLDGEGRIVDVMAGGRWHVRDGKQQVLGTFERTASPRRPGSARS
jgi:beta-aspartyl-dipeptidase (metallo-type)